MCAKIGKYALKFQNGCYTLMSLNCVYFIYYIKHAFFSSKKLCHVRFKKIIKENALHSKWNRIFDDK